MTMRNNPRFQGRMAQREAKKKNKRWLWFLLIPVLLLGVGALSWGTYIYIKAENVISDSYENIGREKSDYRKESVDPGKDNVSILIMGVDANEHRDNHDSARTDAPILPTLNKAEK